MTAMTTKDGRSVDLLVSEITAAGAFGPGVKFVLYEPDVRDGVQDQYSSVVCFGTVTVNDSRDASFCRHRLVIKLKFQEAAGRELVCADQQFHNEQHFYERLLPFLLSQVPEGERRVANRVPSLCRYFYGRNDCGENVLRDVIVLENATPLGYRPSKDRLDLDYDHLVVALRTLAKFHGMSYRAKNKDPATFAALLSTIKDDQWNDRGEWKVESRAITKLVLFYLDRLAENRGGEDDEQSRRFRSEVGDDVTRMLRRTMVPTEPLAVLCHGDYNRNNLLFRYDGATGAPVDALAYDMANVRYGSPALDLSFFLYLNVSPRFRDTRWDQLLDEYCTALAASVSGSVPAVPVPDRAQLDAEMRDRGFYGLSHVSFFMRIMMEDELVMDLENVTGSTGEKLLDEIMKFGGDRATERIVSHFEHFLNLRRAGTR